LYYIVRSGDDVSYNNPEPIVFTNHLGEFYLTEGELSVMPTEYFSTESEAREAILPFLEAWEINSDLTTGIGEISFQFDHAEIVNRNPQPPDSFDSFSLEKGSYFRIGTDMSFHTIRIKYPQPPKCFCATPEVQHAHRRWINYHLGKEHLQSMAYFILTLIEQISGSRHSAASLFHISKKVLNKLGELVSTRGGANTARKAAKSSQYRDLTAAEKQWLKETIRLIIHRMGERASCSTLTYISMDDLPSLNDIRG
jgi:hypothetical protein